MFGRDEKVSEIRLTAAQYIILGIFLVLAYGLWKLQVMESGYYSSAAEKNRVRNVPVLAPRGKILDREGRTIVDNYPSFSALLLRDSSRDLTADADLIAQGLHLDPNEVRARIRHFASMPQYQPIFLKGRHHSRRIAVHRSSSQRTARTRHHHGAPPPLSAQRIHGAPHRLRRRSQRRHAEPAAVRALQPRRRSRKFRRRAAVQHLLMGTNGSRQALVDSHGREVGRLGETEAVPGKPLKLTIDIDLQIAAEEALGDKNGAIVAMDPAHGEILAMVSRPTFDPNDFAVHVIARSMEQAESPIPTSRYSTKPFRRSSRPARPSKSSCRSPAGRKALPRPCTCTATAAQSSTAGIRNAGSTSWRTRRRGSGEGDLSVVRRFFLHAGRQTRNRPKIAKYATHLGLGQKTGIDLPQEASGLSRRKSGSGKNFQQKWYAG
jgi:penicillin-binding protein 2